MRRETLLTRRTFALCLALLLALAGVLLGASACSDVPEDVGYYTESHFVDLKVESNGDVRVTETLKYVYQWGSFRYGYASIPLKYTDGITGVEIWEGDNRYRLVRQDNATQERFTYQVEKDDRNGRLEITWFYPRTTGGHRTFTLKYLFRHAVRVYPGGDQLWAIAIGGEHASKIYLAKATVHLPVDVAASDLRMASYGASVDEEVLDARTIRFSANGLDPGQRLEVRVQWPHGLITDPKPDWQVREEHVQRAVEWGSVLSVGLLLLGFGGLFLLWFVKGRDPKVRAVATYLPYPPGDLSPALAGLLLAEKSDLRFVVATIVDLSRQRAISITSWGERDYEFRLLWDDARIATLRDHERNVLEALFSPMEAMEIEATLMKGNLQARTSLQDLRKHFASYVRPILDEMSRAVMREGLFTDHPEVTAGRYFGVGLGLLLGVAGAVGLLFMLYPNVLNTLASGGQSFVRALSMCGTVGFTIFLSVAFSALMTVLAILGQFVGRYTWYAVLSPWTYVAFLLAGFGVAFLGWLAGSSLVILPPALAVAIWSLGLIVFSFHMPRCTPRGAQEKARWQAFKRYLNQIELFGDLAVAREIFDRYLPYAIAFGIEKNWVRKFVTVDTPAPAWFIVPALGMTAHRARRLQSPVGLGVPGGAPPATSLSDVSDGLYRSLQDVSDGLFNMLGAVSSGLSAGPLQSLTSGVGGMGRTGGAGGWSGGGLGSGGVGGGGRGVG